MSQQDENQDQSFNDAELQDIMNEIESLEREFVEEESDTTTQVEAQAPESETTTEEVVSEETVETQSVETGIVDDSSDTTTSEQTSDSPDSEDEDAESLVNEVAEEYEGNVVSMSEHRAPSSEEVTTASTPGQMQFSGMGNMNFNLNFPVGEAQAEVQVKDGKLLVSLEGVELTLSEDGCEVSMEGGVKFSVPVSSKSAGKKAA